MLKQCIPKQAVAKSLMQVAGNRAVAALLLVIGFASVAYGIWIAIDTVRLVVDTHSPMPQWDEWAVVARYIDLMTSKITPLWFFWEQHNEHRVVLARLVFFLDAGLAGGSQALSKTVTLICAAALVGLFSSIVMQIERVAMGVRVCMVGFFIILFLSNRQIENFIRAFNNQVLTAVLFSCLSLYALARSAENESGGSARDASLWLCAAIGSGVLATYSMASGLIVWPVLLFLSLAMGLRSYAVTWIAAVGLATVASYLWGYSQPRGGPDPLVALVDDPIHVFLYFLTLLANPLGMSIVGSTVAGAGIVALVVYQATRVLLTRHLRVPTVWFLLGVCLLVLGAAAMASTGRLATGMITALSSRYATLINPLWAAVLMLCVIFVERSLRGSRRPWLLVDGVALLSVVAACANVTFAPLWAVPWALDQYGLYEQAATVIVAGAPDRPALRRAFPDPNTISRVTPYLAEHRLSIFRSDADHNIYRALQTSPAKRLSDAMPLDGSWCTGIIEDAKGLVDTGQVEDTWTMLRGWVFDHEAKAKVDAVMFADEAGRLVGAGRVSFSRADAAASRGLDPGLLLRYIGYARVGQDRSVAAFAFRVDRTTLCRFGAIRISRS